MTLQLTNSRFMARVMQETKVLEIQNLTFGYKNAPLLYENLSLHVKVGEVLCILGASGSGKSTLFELITGNLKPKSGDINSQNLSQIFQDPYTSFHPTYSILEQISDVCKLDGYKELCKSLELDIKFLEKKPHELSGGQLQRCSILRALLMHPKLLLADEPTSALDNINQLEVMKLLMKFLDRLGILLITHDENLANWCANRIIRL
ncbi:MAG: peptide/nickel transport system ATP-binding protein [Sulfurospirillum sp.]|nr:peptide/nickel transport system ATP-binding protein [Sulfurospirillum sp.]